MLNKAGILLHFHFFQLTTTKLSQYQWFSVQESWTTCTSSCAGCHRKCGCCTESPWDFVSFEDSRDIVVVVYDDDDELQNYLELS